jgi:NAD(P)-dependent dehydrogenase (short-subunit alcohol dehydrogenase family)
VAHSITVSAFAGFLVAQQAAKRMLPEKHGAILLTGASASVKGYAQSAPFAMGKFALRGLAQSMARRNPQRRANRAGRPAGLDARSRCDCDELLERDAATKKRLDLGS